MKTSAILAIFTLSGVLASPLADMSPRGHFPQLVERTRPVTTPATAAGPRPLSASIIAENGV